MKTLGVKFSDKQVIKIKEISDIVGIDASKLSRAAMLLGLSQIQSLSVVALDEAIDLVLISDARSK